MEVEESGVEKVMEAGARYKGQFIKGTAIRHGKGYQVMPDGSSFEGWWNMDVAVGKGRYIDPKGLFYEG